MFLAFLFVDFMHHCSLFKFGHADSVSVSFHVSFLTKRSKEAKARSVSPVSVWLDICQDEEITIFQTLMLCLRLDLNHICWEAQRWASPAGRKSIWCDTNLTVDSAAGSVPWTFSFFAIWRKWMGQLHLMSSPSLIHSHALVVPALIIMTLCENKGVIFYGINNTAKQ